MRNLVASHCFFAVLFLILSSGCASKSGSIQTVRPDCSVNDTTGCSENRGKSDAVEVGTVESFYESMDASELTDSPEDMPERIIGEEVEREIAADVPRQEPQFDIPIVVNKQVQKWIDYFQTRGRKFFAGWLGRSERYIPMMKSILRQNGLPEDLIFLAMIESGFKPYAYSRARASGPWQFIKRTGTRYGLKVNWWIDERRDPEKSTIAAAAHLKDLYDQFNHWYLAAAGYNAGAGKIERAIRRYRTEDFWEMSKSGYRYLKPETKNYVPKMIAAALIAKEPEKYGFTGIRYDAPIEYDKVLVPEPTELVHIADSLGLSKKDLTELNPELRRGITPPNYPNYELKIPKGLSAKFAQAYPSIREKSISGVSKHVVYRGQTLSHIANRYGVTVSALKSFNGLRSSRIYPGQQLAIPSWSRGAAHRSVASKAHRRVKYLPPSGPYQSYTVKRGDTLWSISRQFEVSVTEILSWNRISDPTNIHPGNQLRLYARTDPAVLKAQAINPGPGWLVHEVQSGDTLWDIARKYNVKVSELREWNSITSRTTIKPGLQLKVQAVNL